MGAMTTLTTKALPQSTDRELHNTEGSLRTGSNGRSNSGTLSRRDMSAPLLLSRRQLGSTMCSQFSQTDWRPKPTLLTQSSKSWKSWPRMQPRSNKSLRSIVGLKMLPISVTADELDNLRCAPYILRIHDLLKPSLFLSLCDTIYILISIRIPAEDRIHQGFIIRIIH